MIGIRPYFLLVISAAMSIVGATLVTSMAHAQTGQPGAGDGGQVRIQGRTGNEPAAAPSSLFDGVLDLKDEMRAFVQRIAAYGRSQKRNFVVLSHGGLELLAKRNTDDDKVAPARTYMRSIDGMIVDAMFAGRPVFGQPTSADFRERIEPLVTLARDNGLAIMTMDFAKDRGTIDRVLQESAKRGFAPAVVPVPAADLATLPTYPARPFNENSSSVLSLKDVKNFVYIANSAGFGRQAEFALKVHGTNYDVVIVDVMHGRQPLSKRAVETLKYKKLGSRRLVLARMDVGFAASYQYYWKEGWREGSPSWITAPHPDDPDRYLVEFWQPQWQEMLSGNDTSYLFGIVKQGYDGVVLESLNSFLFYEGGVYAFAESLP